MRPERRDTAMRPKLPATGMLRPDRRALRNRYILRAARTPLDPANIRPRARSPCGDG